MYDLDDTILAVATPPGGTRSILRISGPTAIEVLRNLVREPVVWDRRGISKTAIWVHGNLAVEAWVYVFPAPHSYTGQGLVEVHLETGAPVIDALVQDLLQAGVRTAGPGEFTARAYLNGKLDLAQAEAVNEIIHASNRLQLRVGQDLLRGPMGEGLEAIRTDILDLLALLEAGLDFADQDVGPLSPDQTQDRLLDLKAAVERLTRQGLQDDSLRHLPSVVIAGSPNAGKSSLFNALVGNERSIVSSLAKTTRDVLAAPMDLARSQVVLLDCAGLLARPQDLLDQLTQQAALESIHLSSLVIFCVDAAKSDYAEDLEVRELIEAQDVLLVATKADLLEDATLGPRLDCLAGIWGSPPLPVSARTGLNLAALNDRISQRLLPDSGKAYERADMLLTARHRQAAIEAASLVTECMEHVRSGREEVAVMVLRSAYGLLLDMDQPVDEEVLAKVFSRFCIGK